MTTETEYNGTESDGLEDVVAARTRLSSVDGANGRLLIAGEEVEKWAARRDFTQLARRLLALAAGEDDTAGSDRLSDETAVLEPAKFRRALGRARAETFERDLSREPLRHLDEPMEALRGALASMPASDDRHRDAVRVLGAIPVANAIWLRLREGETPIPPDPDETHAVDYLRMLGRTDIDPVAAEGLETYWSAVADHGLNASTFAARVVASTGSDLVSAAVAAVGALKGPLHGGAPGPVSDMLDAIGSPERAEEWLRDRLDAGHRIMGMGHRVYDVRDPRAAVFEGAIERIAEASATTERLDLARGVEAAAERVLAERYPDRDLRANVEFYTAVLLEAVGVPRDLFSATFAAGRAAGWAAHVVEQVRTGRLIRPRAAYVEPEAQL